MMCWFYAKLIDQRGWAKRPALGCKKVQPGSTLMLLSKTGPPFSPTLYNSKFYSDMLQDFIILSANVQGDTSRCAQPPVDMKTVLLILKRNFCFVVNKNNVMTYPVYNFKM